MVIGQFHPIIGGAERQCGLLARALLARGYGVRVLTVRLERGAPRHEIVAGVPVERIAYPLLYVRGLRIGCGFLAPLLLAWRAWRILPQYDAVVVHQGLWPAFAVSIAARFRQKPVLCKIGNSGERFDLDVLGRSHWYGAFARRFLLRYVTRFIATSRAVRDDMLRAGARAERVVDIPNGVEVPAVAPARGVRAEFRAAFVGTLTEKKNVATLLEALARCASVERERITLMIIGDGPEHAALEHRAHALGIADRVVFCGMVADPTPLLAESDIFVLPSRTEGLSNAALEAMANGCALLVSNAGGNPDLVPGSVPEKGQQFTRGVTGLLVDPHSPNAIAAALRWLLAHPDERRQMGERARVLVEERYAIDRVATAYETILRTITKPRIVHLVTFLDSRGGMERQALQLACAFRERGGEVFFITSMHLDRMRQERLRIVGVLDGFRVYRIPFLRGWQRLNAVLYTLGGLTFLLALRSRYDIIHAHQLHTSGIVASIAQRFLSSKRVIAKNACSGLYGDVGNLKRLAGGRATAVLRRGVSTFVGVGTETVAEMEATALRPAVSIPNSVRTDAFVPPSAAARERARRSVLGRHAADTFLVLSVGRLHEQKNLRTLIDACALLDDSFVLFLAGDGPERIGLERYRVQRGLATRVRFIGAVEDVLPYYHAADVFVLTSRSEGMPNVVLEAMACGLPIVGSDIAPVRAIIRGGEEGTLVHPDNVVGFADAIRRIKSDRQHAQQMGHRARERIISDFSVDAAAGRYATLYTTLLKS